MFASIASSLVSGMFGMANQKQYLNQQEAANNKAFQQNKELAKLQNQYNIEQWNRENEYNLPENQIKRLAKAGLNPDLMYGNGVSGMTSANSPTMSAGSPISPVDYTLGGNRRTIGDVVQNGLNTALQQAQIRNLNSQSDKLNSETTGININNSTLYETNMAIIKDTLASAGVKTRQIDEISQNIEQSKAYVNEIQASIAEKFANIDNMTFQQFRSMLQYDLDKSVSKATVNNIVANTRLTNHQVDTIVKTLPLIMQKYSAEISEIQSQTSVNSQMYFKIIQDIAVACATEANLDANTQSIDIANIRSKDEVSRYTNLWGVNKDILFALKEIFGTIPVSFGVVQGIK